MNTLHFTSQHYHDSGKHIMSGREIKKQIEKKISDSRHASKMIDYLTYLNPWGQLQRLDDQKVYNLLILALGQSVEFYIHPTIYMKNVCSKLGSNHELLCFQKWEQRATLGSSSFDYDIIPPSDHSGAEMPDHVISDRMRRQFGKFLMFDFRKLEDQNYYSIIGKGRSAHIVSCVCF